MPRRMTQTKPGTHQVLKNSSFESRVISWLMQDGWQIFTPILDNGHQTDLLISDGPNYYRIQVKTIDAKSDEQYVENRWKESNVDCVIFFARNSNWGYVTPAFTQNRKKLNADGHIKFQQSKKEFLKAFHKV
ncbi:MAG: hypothetical protein WBN90_02040 [Gammaproteobacteria bacterium]